MNDGKCLFTCHHSDNNTVLSCTVSFDDQVMMSTSADTTAKVCNFFANSTPRYQFISLSVIPDSQGSLCDTKKQK